MDHAAIFFLLEQINNAVSKRDVRVFPGKNEKSSNQFGTKTHSIEQ